MSMDELMELVERMKEEYGRPLDVLYVTVFVEAGRICYSQAGEAFVHPLTWNQIVDAVTGEYEERPNEYDRIAGVPVVKDDAAAIKAIAEAYGEAQERTGRIDPGYKKSPPVDEAEGAAGLGTGSLE